MKKTVFLGLFVILQTFTFLSCDRGNSNSVLFAQSNNDSQRIVGTWSTEDRSVIITFNNNGTFSVSGDVGSANGNYMVSNSKLIIRNTGDRNIDVLTDYYLSLDGKIFVFYYSDYYRWLIKQ